MSKNEADYQDPNALRERELQESPVDDGNADWWRDGWDRAWSKYREVYEARVRELTAHVERLRYELDSLVGRYDRKMDRIRELTAEIESYRRTISAEYSKREALDEELSQFRATVELVREMMPPHGFGMSDSSLYRIRAALSADPAPAAKALCEDPNHDGWVDAHQACPGCAPANAAPDEPGEWQRGYNEATADCTPWREERDALKARVAELTAAVRDAGETLDGSEFVFLRERLLAVLRG